MFQRSLVAVLAAIGGALVILGGLIGILLSLAPGDFGMRYPFGAGALLYGLVAIIFGVLIIVFSGYTHFRGVESNVTGGVILLVFGIVTWIVVGGWVLVAVGAFLAALAGFLLLLELFITDAQGNRRIGPA